MSMQKANKNEVRKEIADLINRIKEQSDRIGMQREIPQSELDLILHRIEELHRKTVVWSYLNELPEALSAPFPAQSSDTKTAPPVEVIKPVEPPPVPELPKVVEEVKAPVPPVVEPPKPAEEVAKPLAPPIVEVPKSVEEVKPVATPAANQEPKAENREQRATNLKDIKTFIGFNEKLMYIRQVFKGDNAAYDAAIAQFNSISSWDEAQAFLSVLAEEYKWSKHDEPVEIFTQTVKRRFS